MTPEEKLIEEINHESQLLYLTASRSPFHEVVSIIKPLKASSLVRRDIQEPPPPPPLQQQKDEEATTKEIDVSVIDREPGSIYSVIETTQNLAGGLVRRDPE